MTYSSSKEVDYYLHQMINDLPEEDFSEMDDEELLAEAVAREYVDIDDVPYQEITPYVAAYAILQNPENSITLQDAVDENDLAAELVYALQDVDGKGNPDFRQAHEFAASLKEEDHSWLRRVGKIMENEIAYEERRSVPKGKNEAPEVLWPEGMERPWDPVYRKDDELEDLTSHKDQPVRDDSTYQYRRDMDIYDGDEPWH